MTFRWILNASTLGMLIAVMGLGSGRVGTMSWAQTLPETHQNFLNWLRNPAEEDPPNTKRGDEFCLVNLGPDTVNPMWREYPVFVIQGNPRSLALYAEGADDPFWTYGVNQEERVTYSGPPLVAGEVYTLRAQHAQFRTSIYEDRQLTLLSVEARVAIAFDLLTLAEEMQRTGASNDAIALARADYFWQRGLESDAWVEVLPLQATSVEVDEAVKAAYEVLCE